MFPFVVIIKRGMSLYGKPVNPQTRRANLKLLDQNKKRRGQTKKKVVNDVLPEYGQCRVCSFLIVGRPTRLLHYTYIKFCVTDVSYPRCRQSHQASRNCKRHLEDLPAPPSLFSKKTNCKIDIHTQCAKRPTHYLLLYSGISLGIQGWG